MAKSDSKKGSDEDKAIAAVGAKSEFEKNKSANSGENERQVKEEMNIRMNKAKNKK
ncbi:hypothetical protein [Pedobacter chinensis]|uniref:hypothetical protein n=1 Tax=Pedobacter chinensis TaxID=2282421 RepID=UPI001314D644|nr:hypothetical protein [Pedobacter chinensis]